MSISSEQAADYMLKGILSNKSSIYFPKRFSAFIRLLNLMPEFVQRKMCIGMRSNAKRNG
jgi:hypothetical protein